VNLPDKPPEKTQGAAVAPNLSLDALVGKDALRVLNQVKPLQTATRADVAAELPHIRQTAKWAARLT
jgi:hypothetical protein